MRSRQAISGGQKLGKTLAAMMSVTQSSSGELRANRRCTRSSQTKLPTRATRGERRLGALDLEGVEKVLTSLQIAVAIDQVETPPIPH